jgi:hypothetical protein
LGAYRLAVAYTLRFVIPDSSSSILLVEDDAGWALPRVPSDEPEIVIHVAPTLRDLVGRDIFVLRDLRFGSMPPPDDAIVYVTEPHPDPSAARGRWCTEADLQSLDIGDARDRSAVLSWFRDEEPASLQPWQRAGWFETCVAWIEDVLPDVFHVRQFATWCNSCILRVEAAAGRSYVKASPAYFAREPIVTAMLAELFPGRTPEVLAVDADRRWMVLEDLGDEPADGLAVGERLGALAAIAELHAASMSHVDALLDGGCFDRRPDVLSAQIAALAADPTVPLPGDLAERFRAAVPRLQELCAELALSPIQPTLVHGDLHAGNVMRTGGRFVVFDWTDACVADPFVDVLMFLTRLPDDPRLRARFRDRYFEAWGDVVSRSEAAEYAELAEPLAAMHHAVTYRGIYDAFGEYEWWLFERALPRWIEHALGSRLLSPRGSPNGI